MTRYLRQHILQDGSIVDAVKLDDEFNQAFVPYNGGLDANNFANAAFTVTKIADRTFHDLTDVSDPYGSSGVSIDKQEVNTMAWTLPDTLSFDFTSDDEGAIIGTYSGTIGKKAQTVELGELGWAVACFLDGRLIARTELCPMQNYGIELPFAAPVDKGAHSLRFGYRGKAYSASVSGDEVFSIAPPQIWWVLKKR